MTISPPDIIRQVAIAAYLARSLQTIAEIGVADHLDETPTPVAALATKLKLNSGALLRVLRLLSANGVFFVSGEIISHTPASRLLRSDNPRSMRSLPVMYGLDEFWSPLKDFRLSLETGKAVSASVPEIELWSLLERNPEAARRFDAGMAGRAHGQVAATVANYDFSKAHMIGDIGGGRGHLVKAVLDNNPKAKGVVFDLPDVVAGISHHASNRLTIQGGNFFNDTLPECDLYLVMDVIHDWGDAESRAILSAIRKSAPARSKLLLIERIMTADNEISFVKSIDIMMLTLLGGKQRTRQEFEELFNASGWTLTKVIDTDSGLSLIEAAAS
jgi:O-methyltransferase domain